MIIHSLFLFALAPPVFADPLEPDPVIQLDELQTARALSLQLRGTIPTMEELTEIEAAGGVEEDRLDGWLNSENFQQQVMRHHRSLFWNATVSNELEKTRLLSFPDGVYYGKYRSTYTRGLKIISCSDWENTDINQWNQPQSTQTGSKTTGNQEYTFVDEGWVWVTPYWDMNSQIKVCAFDAQTNPYSETGTDCTTKQASTDPDCGCGPNLRWCMTRDVQTVFRTSFAEELTERVRVIIQNDLPYTELLVANNMMFNGPLSFYYQHLDAFVDITSSPTTNIPDLDYTQNETWVQAETTEQYSGALTAPGWLLRHQTNRGRANRFYEAFLCKSFVPPAGGIVDDAGSTPDLSLRQGCAECHTRLEPWRAYWGRWAEVSSSYITEEALPKFSQQCADCAEDGNCDSYCRKNYMVEPIHEDDYPYIGWYLPYVYLKQGQQHHPDDGPSAWIQNVVDDGSLSRCVTQNAAQWLLGWSDEELDSSLITEWTAGFENSNLDYKQLIREIISHPTYRRRK